MSYSSRIEVVNQPSKSALEIGLGNQPSKSAFEISLRNQPSKSALEIGYQRLGNWFNECPTCSGELTPAANGKQARPDAGSCAAGGGNRSRLGRSGHMVSLGPWRRLRCQFLRCLPNELSPPLDLHRAGFFEQSCRYLAGKPGATGARLNEKRVPPASRTWGRKIRRWRNRLQRPQCLGRRSDARRIEPGRYSGEVYLGDIERRAALRLPHRPSQGEACRG
jgi:hypothetical protein